SPGDALAALRAAIMQAAIACGAVPIAAAAPRLPNTACLALPGVRAETQVIALDLAGVRVSAGAACSSGKVARSHVLDAMGLGALAGEAIRVSLPWNASAEDVRAFADAYQAMAERLARRAA
ncbi:cysteine desulfurase, partial [Rhodovastum sp. RN2-1]|nr:cysteine desulfurase [Limobrevibacterium gyesilva]